MKNYKKIVFKHSAASLTKLYYGREGSAVQTFQTNPTPKILGSGFYLIFIYQNLPFTFFFRQIINYNTVLSL